MFRYVAPILFTAIFSTLPLDLVNRNGMIGLSDSVADARTLAPEAEPFGMAPVGINEASLLASVELNKKATTVVEVVLNEMAGSAVVGVENAYQDALHIVSTIMNRAKAARLFPESIVSVRQEFNGYGIRMRPGAKKDLNLATEALRQVAQTGPVHKGMFYATPACVGNLPDGLVPVGRTAGHVFFVDPQGRSYKTTQGYVRPRSDYAGEFLQTLLRLETPIPLVPHPV